MNKVIQALAQLAGNSSLLSKENTISFIESTELTELQKQSIKAGDIDTLVETLRDLPVIKCFPVVPAEDEDSNEEEEKEQQSDETQNVVNY